VGFASAGPNRDSLLPFAGEVQTLYVLPELAETRVSAGCCCRAAFARLRNHGIGSAVIWVLAENPARFLLRAHGGQGGRGERDERLWGRAAA